MKKAHVVLASVAAVLLLGVLIRLGGLQAGGPVHAELMLEGDIPAILYLPQEGPGTGFGLPDPLPPAERPPVVVLAHGFASDRAGMSTLARSLAVAGYAVLTPDLQGHGTNRNDFSRGSGREDFLVDDLSASVEFLRASPHVDGSRIAVAGHSMGAGAALAYATRDSAIDAAVMISGGRRRTGPYRPANAFFIYAEGDPEMLKERSAELGHQLATELHGVDEARLGETHGTFRMGTAVRWFEVPGENHVSIVASDEAAMQIVAWLDNVFAMQRAEPAKIVDPRSGPVRLGLVLLILVLPGIGVVVGRLAGDMQVLPADRPMRRIGVFAVALFVTLPLLAVGVPGLTLPLIVVNVTAVHLMLVGVALVAALVLSGELSAEVFRGRWVGAFGAALVGMIGIYFLMGAVTITLHGSTPTPERFGVIAVLTAILIPFHVGFNWLLRRGSFLASTGLAVTGRLLVGASLVVGVSAGIFPGVIGLVIPMLILLFLMFEIVSATVYATSGNTLAAGILEAMWLAWSLGTAMPIVL